MKTLKQSILSISFILFTFAATAQVNSEKIKVAGECGMCKKTIETAAKNAGATYAVWNVESKELSVKYDKKSSSRDKIQKAVAAKGYDTPGYKATDESYEQLHECCKYDRTAATGASCCAADPSADCCRDGKCTKDPTCCKDGKCTDATTAAASCCKKS
jgi:hypothetical protein